MAFDIIICNLMLVIYYFPMNRDFRIALTAYPGWE